MLTNTGVTLCISTYLFSFKVILKYEQSSFKTFLPVNKQIFLAVVFFNIDTVSSFHDTLFLKEKSELCILL